MKRKKPRRSAGLFRLDEQPEEDGQRGQRGAMGAAAVISETSNLHLSNNPTLDKGVLA